MILKITLLVDNQTLVDQYYLAEPALCVWIESGESRILFDTGYSDVFLENAQRLNLNISELDALVLSHGHSDHTWGVPALADFLRRTRQRKSKVKLIAHPDVFCEKTQDGETIGVNFEIRDFLDVFECCFTRTPLPLGSGVHYLGEIPRATNFEAKNPIGKTRSKGPWIDDFIQDDSGVAVCVSDGLVIVSGCAHSGIVNMVQHAMEVTGEKKIVDIIGGLHLQNPTSAQLEGTVAYFESLNLNQLHACHCTDLPSKCRLLRSLPLREIGSGSILVYE